MSREYLDFIPIILPNVQANAILLTCIPAVFYCAASYGSLYIKNSSLMVSFLVSISFAILFLKYRFHLLHVLQSYKILQNYQDYTKPPMEWQNNSFSVLLNV